MTSSSPLHEVRSVLERLSRAWRNQRFADLDEVLDEAVVFVRPGIWDRLSGRAACVESYVRFMGLATILDYAETEVSLDVWDSTAVAVYHWTMRWEMEGTQSTEQGHDILALARRPGGWRVVWRTMITVPAE